MSKLERAYVACLQSVDRAFQSGWYCHYCGHTGLVTFDPTSCHSHEDYDLAIDLRQAHALDHERACPDCCREVGAAGVAPLVPAFTFDEDADVVWLTELALPALAAQNNEGEFFGRGQACRGMDELDRGDELP